MASAALTSPPRHTALLAAPAAKGPAQPDTPARS